MPERTSSTSCGRSKDRAPLHDRVMAWLFAAGSALPHPPRGGVEKPDGQAALRRGALACLRPTAARDVYEASSRCWVARTMGPERVAHHLDRMTQAFDAAKPAINTPFFFASDISDTRPADQYRREQGDDRAGDHREAVFWIVATYCRCLKILDADALGASCLQFTLRVSPSSSPTSASSSRRISGGAPPTSKRRCRP